MLQQDAEYRGFEREDSINHKSSPSPSHHAKHGTSDRSGKIGATRLDVVNVDLLLVTGIRLIVRISIAELEVSLAILALAETIGLVDLGVLGQLAVRLERAGLVGRVLEDHVALVVLEVAEREEDDVALVDPDLLAHLATDLLSRG